MFDKLKGTHRKAADHRAAANLASSANFGAEPLDGVGSETWRAMWDAARQYSEVESYVGREFPAAELSDRCVLCHQDLTAEARDRLHRFHQFMSDETEQLATDSQRDFETMLEAMSEIQCESTDVAVALVSVEAAEPSLAETCREAIQAFKDRQDLLLRSVGGEKVGIPAVPVAPIEALEAASKAASAAASMITNTAFQQSVGRLAAERSELEGRRIARAARGDIAKEADRLAQRLVLRRQEGRPTRVRSRASQQNLRAIT